MVHVHQLVVIDHCEVTFITSETPNDRSVCSIDLDSTAGMEPADDIVVLEVLLYAVYMTGEGQFSLKIDLLISICLLLVNVWNR